MLEVLNHKPKRSILNAILILLVILQLTFLLFEFGPYLNFFRKNLGKSSLWRSVSLSSNENMADYIEWLDNNIPENAKVLIPQNGYHSFKYTTQHMQVFLSPREISNCSADYYTCASETLGGEYYILVLKPSDFPGDQYQELSGRSSYLNDSLGFIRPVDSQAQNPIKNSALNSVLELPLKFILPLLFAAAAAFPFVMVVNSTHPKLSIFSQSSLGFLFGMGALSLAATILLIHKIPYTPLLVLTALGIIWALCLAYLYFVKQKKGLSFKLNAPAKGALIWLVIFLVLAIIAAAVSLGRGYQLNDEIILWGAKGYGIASHGLSEGATSWGTLSTKYPLNIPISISIFKVLFQDFFQESRILFPLFYLSFLILSFEILKKKLPQTTAGLATLLMGSSFVIFLNGSTAYANLPAAVYFLAGVIILANSPSIFPSAPSRSLIGGGLIVLACWTRPEVLQIAWVLLTVLTALLWEKRSRKSNLFINLIPLGLLLIYTVFWLFAQNQIYITGTFSDSLIQNGLSILLSGNFNLAEFFYIPGFFIKALFDFTQFGVTGWLMVILVVYQLLQIRREANLKAFFPSIIGVLYLLIIMGTYYLTSYQTNSTYDISWWLSTGLMRMSLPGILLLFINLWQTDYSAED